MLMCFYYPLTSIHWLLSLWDNFSVNFTENGEETSKLGYLELYPFSLHCSVITLISTCTSDINIITCSFPVDIPKLFHGLDSFIVIELHCTLCIIYISQFKLVSCDLKSSLSSKSHKFITDCSVIVVLLFC